MNAFHHLYTPEYYSWRTAGWYDAFQMIFEKMEGIISFSNGHKKLLYQQGLLLHDLSHGSGLAFMVVLLFHALWQLFKLSMSLSKETHSVLYTTTFQAITSDWSKYKCSLGTQNLLLDMVVLGCNIVGFISSNNCPAYIENKFLVLLGNILEGHRWVHISTMPCRLLPVATSLLHTAFMCCSARRWKSSSLVHGDRHCSAHHLAPLWTSFDTQQSPSYCSFSPCDAFVESSAGIFLDFLVTKPASA